MHGNIFVEVSALIALCAGIAMIMRFLRQPLIIGYIITGLIVGPSLLSIVNNPETIDLLGNFGVALLLFIVGLGLNPKVIKEVGRVSVLTGLGQVIFTSLIGYAIATRLGYDTTTALYIAVGLAFSSTIIILKLLNDKKEQNKLYGKISIGFLLVQDILATIALVIASASSQGSLDYNDFFVLTGKALGAVAAIFLITKFIIKPMTNFLTNTQELLFLFSIAWGFGIATIFYELGFSLEVGALVAGASLATMTYAQEVGSRLRPLRDFFIIVFFIALGTRINVADIQSVLPHAALLSSFVLIGNPIIVMMIMGLLGYTKRTSFKAGLAVAQISEFSLILILLGANNGQLSDQVISLMMVVALITIAISSYMIIYSDGLFKVLDKYLSMFERKKTRHEHMHRKSVEAVLFGFKKGGSEYTTVFKKLEKEFVVVDYDPDSIDEIERRGIDYIYGDATSLQLLEEIDLSKVKLVVSVMTDHDTNLFILHHLQTQNPSAVVICHADNINEAIELYGLGASFVVLPHHIGNEKVSEFIKKNGFKKSEFNRYRKKHLQYLQQHFEAPEKD